MRIDHARRVRKGATGRGFSVARARQTSSSRAPAFRSPPPPARAPEIPAGTAGYRDDGDESRFSSKGRFASPTPDAFRLAIRPGASECEVILMIAAHAWKMLDDGNPVGPQRFFGTDARLHENFRRMDGAKRQYRLATRAELAAFATEQNPDPAHLLAVEHEPCDQRIGENSKVGLRHHPMDIGAEYRLSPAFADPQLRNRCASCALHHLAVGICQRPECPSSPRHSPMPAQWAEASQAAPHGPGRRRLFAGNPAHRASPRSDGSSPAQTGSPSLHRPPPPRNNPSLPDGLAPTP